MGAPKGNKNRANTGKKKPLPQLALRFNQKTIGLLDRINKYAEEQHNGKTSPAIADLIEKGLNSVNDD